MKAEWGVAQHTEAGGTPSACVRNESRGYDGAGIRAVEERELSSERLAGSSSAHSVQLQHDKENRLLRELAAQKLLEASLRAQLAEEAEILTREKEDRIRLSERLERVGSELRSSQDSLRSREDELLSDAGVAR